jgi:hypothetical protein
VWNQSTVNEKVYTVSMFFMAMVTWLAVHWGDDEPGAHRDRWLILIAYLLALTSTNHMMGALAAPAVIVYVLWTDWRVLTRPAVLAGIVVAVVVGLTPNYIFLPIRAGQFPAINEGEPVGLDGRLEPGPVRQALGFHQSGRRHAAVAGTVRGSAGDVLAIFFVAVRSGLGPGRPVRDRALLGAGVAGTGTADSP